MRRVLAESGCRTLFLFGAGASAAHRDVFPYPPPVGPKLFNKLVEQGGVAARLSGRIGDEFGRNFEAGMHMLYEERSELVPELICDVATYFLRFRPTAPGPYTELIKQLYREPNALVAYSTLNYDLLLELSAPGRFEYFGQPADVPHLYKLHGASNFLPDLGDNTIRFHPDKLGRQSVVVGAPTISVTAQEALDFLHRNFCIPPVMSAYAIGKHTLSCPQTIADIRADWTRLVERADRIVVVGTAINRDDAHLWGPLARTAAQIGWADLSTQSHMDWSREYGREDVVLGADFATSIPAIVDFASGRHP